VSITKGVILRRKPSISGVLAATALFFAVAGGGAYAADTYLITSTHQIKPSVLKQLANDVRGPRGTRGPAGPQGLIGSQGQQGQQGQPGNTGATGPQGQQGNQGAQGLPGQQGLKGDQGDQGSQGLKGDQGDQGLKGDKGDKGDQGASGVNSPLVYTYAANVGPDSGDCGNAWATDSYSRTFVVSPQADGSFTVFETVGGSFVTLAGVSEPNPADCATDSQTGDVNGNFYGSESWTVPAPAAGQSADFNPTAACSDCSAQTTGSTSSNDQGNAAFQAAFFPGSTYNGVTNYDFVYTTPANGSWIDSNTPLNNDQANGSAGGNITGRGSAGRRRLLGGNGGGPRSARAQSSARRGPATGRRRVRPRRSRR
jgi:Collagen triple helix repeat (20 copies)